MGISAPNRKFFEPILLSFQSVNFRQFAAYVIWFGTHKEYDKIDASKISFDIYILNFKSAPLVRATPISIPLALFHPPCGADPFPSHPT
jgi:hypothetical protein